MVKLTKKNLYECKLYLSLKFDENHSSCWSQFGDIVFRDPFLSYPIPFFFTIYLWVDLFIPPTTFLSSVKWSTLPCTLRIKVRGCRNYPSLVRGRERGW